MRRILSVATCLSIFGSILGVTSLAHAFGERQWYSCECQANERNCVLGSKIEAGLSKDSESGRVTDYAVAVKTSTRSEDIGIWDPTYFADDIRFDHKINGFEHMNTVSLVLESGFAKKETPVLKAQIKSRSNDYNCRKI